jgi:aquaporin Z
MRSALKAHWPKYLMEAAGLGIFMISACMVVALLEHPASPVRQSLPSPFLRRALIGIAMGLTAIGIVYSPWGKQSGAHLNPSLTLTFFRLGKVHGWDAFFYVLAQFAGGLSGVLVAAVPPRRNHSRCFCQLCRYRPGFRRDCYRIRCGVPHLFPAHDRCVENL